MTSNAAGAYTTTNPLGVSTNTTAVYKTVTLQNGGTFRLAGLSYNDNVTTTTNVGAGQVFFIGAGGGTFDIAAGATMIIDDGAGAGTAAANAQLQGTGDITKIGLGILQQDDSVIYGGAFNVVAGTLQPASANAFGTATPGTTIQSGAQLNCNGITMTNAEQLTLNGPGLAVNPQGALTNLSATLGTWVGPVTLNSNSTIGNGSSGGLTLAATATIGMGANNLTFTNTGSGRIQMNSVISGTGAVTYNGTSTGDFSDATAHTYTGGTTVQAGSVAVGAQSAGPAGNPASGPFGAGTTPLVLAGGQMRSGTGASFTIANVVSIANDFTFYTTGGEQNLVFSGPVTLLNGTRTLTSAVGTTVAGTSVIFNGAIGDGGNVLGLNKAGAGNLTLAGANTYTGPTTVNAGTLFLSGTLASPTLSVAGGATLNLSSGNANSVNVTSFYLGAAAATTTLTLEEGVNTFSSDNLNAIGAATTAGSIIINICPAGFRRLIDLYAAFGCQRINCRRRDIFAGRGSWRFSHTA